MDSQDEELEDPGEDDEDKDLFLGVPHDHLLHFAAHIHGHQHIRAKCCRPNTTGRSVNAL